MKKIYKITNIALVFMLIGVFVLSNTLYAADFTKDTHLRVPLMHGSGGDLAERNNMAQVKKMSTKKLVELIGALDNDFISASIKRELLDRVRNDPPTSDTVAKELIALLINYEFAEIAEELLFEISNISNRHLSSVIRPLVGGLKDPKYTRSSADRKRVEINKRLILEILENKNVHWAARFLVKALGDPTSMKSAKEVLLKLLEIRSGEVVKKLKIRSEVVVKALVEGLIDKEYVESKADLIRTENAGELLLEASKVNLKLVTMVLAEALSKKRKVKIVKSLLLEISEDSEPCLPSVMEALGTVLDVPKCTEPAKELFLIVAKKDPRIAVNILGRGLDYMKDISIAKDLFLKMAKTRLILVIKHLMFILKVDNKPKIKDAIVELLTILKYINEIPAPILSRIDNLSYRTNL